MYCASSVVSSQHVSEERPAAARMRVDRGRAHERGPDRGDAPASEDRTGATRPRARTRADEGREGGAPGGSTLRRAAALHGVAVGAWAEGGGSP